MTATPAYEKYAAHLVSDELVLPAVFRKLETLFDEMETTIKLLNGQTCYFERLRQVVAERQKQ